MSKELEIPTRRRQTRTDNWSDATAPAAVAEEEPKQKLSLHVPIDVHTEAKSGAARRRSSMVNEYIEMIRARSGTGPWPADVVASVLAQVVAAGEPWPAEVVDSVVHQLEADRDAAAEPKTKTRASARGKKSA